MPAADAPGSGPTEITVRTYPEGFPYTGPTENTMLVAFQDGDGAWSALTGSGGVYHATATAPRYGVALGCATAYGSQVTLYYQAVSDATELRSGGCVSTASMVHVTVDLQGLQAQQTAEVFIGGYDLQGDAAGTQFAGDIPRGMYDVFARSMLSNGSRAAIKLYRGSTLNLQADQALQINLDTVGLPPESHPITLAGQQAPDTIVVDSSYSTPHSQLQWPVSRSTFGAPPADGYVTVPAVARQPGDVSNVAVSATGLTPDGRSYERSVRLAMATPTAPHLELPGPWTVDSPTIDKAAGIRATFTLPIAPATLQTADYTAIFDTFVTTTIFREWSVIVGSGWAGSEPSVTITTPDLSGLMGWNADMALAAGMPVRWFMARYDRNLPYDAIAVDGRRILRNAISGIITP